MKNKIKSPVIILSIVLVALGFCVGMFVGRQNIFGSPIFGNSNSLPSNDLNGIISTFNTSSTDLNLNTFSQIYQTIKNEYVDKNIDDKKLYEGAIKGMVSALGDYATLYYTKEETEEYQKVIGGNFEGIGAELGYLGGYIIIKNVLNGSPAESVGLKNGSLIVKVDDENIKINSDLYLTVAKIRGTKGTQVKITVKEPGSSENKIYTITRDTIHSKSIDIIEESGNIVRIRINRFTEDSLEAFQSVWDDIVKQVNELNPKGIILDLRGNPGGYLNGAYYIASDFLDEGKVVLYVEGREGIEKTYTVSRKGRLLNYPVIVMVDSGSASASEILTGALQKNNKAEVVGTETVGKGTAQEVLNLSTWSGASLHLTVQHWLLPDKSWLNADNPIKPDIIIEESQQDLKAGNDVQLKTALSQMAKIIDKS